MAEARSQGRIFMLAVACLLGLAAPALGQSTVTVEQRPIPPSLTGELGESDILRAVSLIRDLGVTFGGLAARAGTGDPRWVANQRTYRDAARKLDAMRTDGRIAIRDLPGGEQAAVAGGGIVLDTTLAGDWQADAVRTRRKLGTGDWADISRLAGVLVEQLALDTEAGDWDAWRAAHSRSPGVRDLAEEAPAELLRPLLVRFWHLQDKYLANALAPSGGGAAGSSRANRAAALSNDLLAVLKQAEDVGGWRWRKPLESEWDESVGEARDLAGAMPAAKPAELAEAPEQAPPEQTPPEQTPPEQAAPAVEPPRSADFDELFADKAQAPLATAAGPVEDPALRADVDALYRENDDRIQESRDLGARLNDLVDRVTALAANVAEQGRRLETLTDDMAVARTIPDALATLSASQAALERRLAELAREAGPDGLSGQLSALMAAVDSEQSRSREAEQRLEARVQERLRMLSGDVAAASRRVAELQSELTSIRPSATAIVVPLQDTATRRSAFRQAVIAGIALLALLFAAIAFWIRGARLRSDAADRSAGEAAVADAAVADDPPPSVDEGGLSTLMDSLHAVDRNALRDELTQLRGDIDAERSRAGDLEERLKRVTARLGESQARAKQLSADLAAVREDTQTVGRGLLDGAARDAEIGHELAGLRQAIEVERERAAGLQLLVDELKSSVAEYKSAASQTAAPKMAPPPADHQALRRRAIEALHRNDLPGFERAFAELAALPPAAVERIVHHNGVRDLALACRAVGIAKPHLAAILILSRRARPGADPDDRHLAPRELAEAMAAYDQPSDEAAEKVLLGWRTQAHEAGGLRATELT